MGYAYEVILGHTRYRRATDPLRGDPRPRGNCGTDIDSHVARLGQDIDRASLPDPSPAGPDPNLDPEFPIRPSDERG